VTDATVRPGAPCRPMGKNRRMDIHGSALVTGASRGIGRAIALELAHRGFDTIATMRDPAAGATMPSETPGRLVVQRLDVTDPSSFDLPGDLRILVNNAGIDTDYLPVEHSVLDDWRRLFETNVFGVVALTAAAIPTLRENAPSVVCTVSSSSIIASVPFYSAYRASKAAVSAFDDSLRVEVAPFGIRVVEILPGPIDTDMFRLSTGEQDAARFAEYRTLAGVAESLRREHADPRVVDAAHAAKAVVDALLDSSGPMRYGCDPVSLELLDLWRQCDDETVFTMTGRSLLDQAAAPDGGGAASG
jgi:NAD(P)-dependent dehydrogenase (short-subunit alcohol dehydrogenase family)